MRSVENALRVIDYLAEHEEAGVSDVSKEIGVAVSTAHRLLSALGAAGYVTQEGDRQKYRLSVKIFQLGTKVANRNGLRQAAIPSMERLAASSGETANLGILDGQRVVYLEKVLNDASMRVELQVGRAVPAHCTALGKAILAFQRPDTLSRIIKGYKFEPRTKSTIMDPATLRRELAVARRRGFAIDREENFDGIRCIAAPVFGQDGIAIAALSLAGPASRMPGRLLLGLAPMVIEAATQVSVGLGFDVIPTLCPSRSSGRLH